jgi:hypothetical protein
MNHLLTNFFQKFVKIFEKQGAPPSTTPVANLPKESTTLAANFASGILVSELEGKNLSIC